MTETTHCSLHTFVPLAKVLAASSRKWGDGSDLEHLEGQAWGSLEQHVSGAPRPEEVSSQVQVSWPSLHVKHVSGM